MRLLCDAMLGRLARWLRAAGHDVRFAGEEAGDSDLVALARNEGRVLLTRDRRLAERTAARGRVVLLGAENLSAQARELKRGLGLDWLCAPFTRCVVDNTPLRPASADEIARLPGKVRALGGAVFACPECGRLYWAGDHHRHMRARLSAWAAAP